MYNNLCNQQVTKLINSFSWLKVGTSETIRTQKILFSTKLLDSSLDSSNNNLNTNDIILESSNPDPNQNLKDKKFKEWLAGLIDGDGCFGVTDGKYTNCEITTGIEDEKMLCQIQNKFGGSVQKRSGVNAIRYRLRNKDGMINLVNAVNGNIRNSVRLTQYFKICRILDVKVIHPIELTKDNAWFMGFFDADGTINISNQNDRPQLFVSISNKNYWDVKMLKDFFGGNIYFDSSGYGGFKWSIVNEVDHTKWYEYNKLSCSRSNKGKRNFLIKDFYDLYNRKAYKQDPELKLLNKAWEEFKLTWNR